jgi:hypothetical protein
MGSGIDGTVHITDRDGNPNVFNLNEDDIMLSFPEKVHRQWVSTSVT